MPYELCLPLETINTDLHSQNQFHHRLLQYSTNHLNHLANSTHQLNYVCGADSCDNTNCDQLLPHSFLDTTSNEITLESGFNANTTTLNRRTIPVTVLPSTNNNQTNLISTINSPLTCGHLLNINQQNSTICNSIDQNSNTSIDDSLEQNTNRVFFIRTSNADHLNQNLHTNKVQITDTGYNDKTKQDLDQMLYLTAVNQPNSTDQYDYYKILNRTPIFSDSYGNEQNFNLNYNGLELLTNSYLHEQVINLNNEQINKTHLDNFNKEISNVEILDNTIESNQSVSLNNNKTVSYI